LETDVKGIRDDIGQLKGWQTKSVAQPEAPLIAAEGGLDYMRTLSLADVVRLTRNVPTSHIPANRLLSFRKADIVIEAVDEDGEDCYLVAEVSYTVDERDTARAIRHAGYLTEFTGRRAHAAVVGLQYDERVRTIIESGEVVWYRMDPISLQAE
jgi:hypothetical protein